MDERIEKWLYDIKNAITEIESFTSDVDKTNFESYKGNLILKRAIERELEIIGEAMNRIIKASPDYLQSIPEAKQIIRLRNDTHM